MDEDTSTTIKLNRDMQSIVNRIMEDPRIDGPTAAVEAALRFWNALAVGGEYAEIYMGSGRFTGRRSSEPTRTDRGDPAPNWVYVGNMSDEQFEERFVAGEHDACHSRSRPDDRCPHCERAGWLA